MLIIKCNFFIDRYRIDLTVHTRIHGVACNHERFVHGFIPKASTKTFSKHGPTQPDKGKSEEHVNINRLTPHRERKRGLLAARSFGQEDRAEAEIGSREASNLKEKISCPFLGVVSSFHFVFCLEINFCRKIAFISLLAI